MNPLSAWLNVRAVRREALVHERDLRAEFTLWNTGRYAEFAEEMAVLAQEYLRHQRVMSWFHSHVSARVRRCDALIRAGQPEQAHREAEELTAILLEAYPPDGGHDLAWMRARLAAAERGEERPDYGPPIEF